MKNKLLIFASVLILSSIAIFLINNKNEEEDTIAKLQQQHKEYLENSPFKDTKMLPRAERKALGLPPNAYNEQMWEMTMDPATGTPMPERLLETQAQLIAQRTAFNRGVGGDDNNPWVDRGPNNQGGRTRGIMFDPNDVGNANPADDYTRVLAGGVSGGLWVNEDITDPNSSWTQLNIQANISVTKIIYDPNDTNTFYIGSGESFTSGDAVGRGVWKSTDAGISWTNILGGYESFSPVNGDINGIFYVNDIVARDNGGTTEIYAAVASSSYTVSVQPLSPSNFHGLDEMGLYKSVDGGANWNRFNITHNNGNFKNPCDIELDMNNNVWFTTTSNPFGDSGGDIYKSTDGNNFTLEATINGAARTELEASSSNPNLFWVAANRGTADLFFTANGFSTIQNTSTEPNDVDTGIPSNDYTRGQAFYDLVIEADENNNLYVGGIDLFRSGDFGISWDQISKWSNNNNLAALQVPSVHADQHAIVFRPGSNDTEAVIGNDGGIYYSPDIFLANSNPGNTNAIQERNNDYNTIQFYSGDINQVDAANGEDLTGGTQDNGTRSTFNAGAGANAFAINVGGGDGGYTEISKDGTYGIRSLPGQLHIYTDFPNVNSNNYVIVNDAGGDFVNAAELDDNRHVLYTNSSSGGFGIGRFTNVNNQALLNGTVLSDGTLNSRPTAFKLNPYATNGVEPTNTATLIAGLRNGRVLKITSADTAPVFSNISGPSFVGSVSDIEFGQNENEIFVTMHNYGVESIWFTDNGGTTWTSLQGNLPDLPVKCILQNPLLPNELIIGTELGVWATGNYTAANPNWIQAYNGMSDVTVVDLDLRTSDNTILATTHGRGMFTSQFTAAPLSVLENQLSSNLISIFPTISNGEITVTSKNNFGDADMNIYSINGQKVYTSKINISDSRTKVNLSLNSGIYFVKINVGSITETKKIIIK